MTFDLKKNEQISGLLLIDKSKNIPSTHVVRCIKRNLHQKKVGHLGTLDPFATGLLPIMIGSSARLCDELMGLDKTYLFEIQLGIETDTLDSTGKTIKTADVSIDLNEKIIKDVLKLFTGEIRQVPPVYSALKMNGRPLYEYMRASGQLPCDIESKTRTIQIHQCDFIKYNDQNKTIKLRVRCSKGTYIRSLARDISFKLGTVGMCSELRREGIGQFSVENACILPNKFFLPSGSEDNNLFIQHLFSKVLSPKEILPDICTFEFSESYLSKLKFGNVLLVHRQSDLELFQKLEKFLCSSANNKFFAKISHYESPFFLSSAEFMSDDSIKVRPNKKLL